MNRLANTPRHTGALRTVLNHLEDTHPDEHETALELLADPTCGHTTLADALTRIAQEDNLGVRVGEKAIRDTRKANTYHGKDTTP